MAQPHHITAPLSSRNVLLDHLEPPEQAAIFAHLEEVAYRAGDVLVEPDRQPDHVYFPQTAVISYVALFAGGGAVEVGTVGCEGMSGIHVYLGTGASPYRAIVQVEGIAQRMPVDAFRRVVDEHPGIDAVLSRYVDAYLMQVSQTAACNRMHDLAQRAARWLLMTHDRVGSDSFALTHEFLAIMLGVRRAGVSEAAADLQRRGAIRYSRGKVTIADRAILEQQACECYGVVRDRYRTLARPAGARAAHLSAS